MNDAAGDTLRLDTFLPFRLSVLSNAVSRKIADMYEREFDISIWQWRILAVLGENDGLTSTEVAGQAGGEPCNGQPDRAGPGHADLRQRGPAQVGPQAV